MTFVKNVLADVAAILLSVIIVVVMIAWYGSSPQQRYDCQMETDNAVQDAICILKIAL